MIAAGYVLTAIVFLLLGWFAHKIHLLAQFGLIEKDGVLIDINKE